MQEWLGKNIHDKNIAEIIKTVLRLNTYGNDSDIQSIGSAFLQISSASVGGATYLDWGWQTLVDGLEMSAKDHKARIITGKKAIRVEKRSRNSSGWRVMLSDNTQISAM
ncbi:MAG: hypothetical protein ACJ70Z_03340 [Nitrososphaera sp.]